MKYDHTGFRLDPSVRTPKQMSGDSRMAMEPPIKGGWFDRKGVFHVKSRMSANWNKGRGKSTTPTPSNM